MEKFPPSFHELTSPEYAAKKKQFLEYIRSRIDQTTKSSCIGGKNYSARDLAEEVEKDSEVGRKIVRMFEPYARVGKL